jgi:hypothetical protein
LYMKAEIVDDDDRCFGFAEGFVQAVIQSQDQTLEVNSRKYDSHGNEQMNGSFCIQAQSGDAATTHSHVCSSPISFNYCSIEPLPIHPSYAVKWWLCVSRLPLPRGSFIFS